MQINLLTITFTHFNDVVKLFPSEDLSFIVISPDILKTISATIFANTYEIKNKNMCITKVNFDKIYLSVVLRLCVLKTQKNTLNLFGICQKNDRAANECSVRGLDSKRIF
jgi:hypothetical protein